MCYAYTTFYSWGCPIYYVWEPPEVGSHLLMNSILVPQTAINIINGYDSQPRVYSSGVDILVRTLSFIGVSRLGDPQHLRYYYSIRFKNVHCV